MSEFPVNAKRFDPYKNFKFRVRWDGQYLAAISRVTGLVRTAEVVEHREGGDPSTSRKSPGRTDFEPLTLERGLTQDSAFEDWADLVWKFGSGPGAEVALREFRKDIAIDLYNKAGQLVIAYKVFRCWPSVYEALPELDANGTAVAVERMTLQNEGWVRDRGITEPVEP